MWLCLDNRRGKVIENIFKVMTHKHGWIVLLQFYERIIAFLSSQSIQIHSMTNDHFSFFMNYHQGSIKGFCFFLLAIYIDGVTPARFLALCVCVLALSSSVSTTCRPPSCIVQYACFQAQTCPPFCTHSPPLTLRPFLYTLPLHLPVYTLTSPPCAQTPLSRLAARAWSPVADIPSPSSMLVGDDRWRLGLWADFSCSERQLPSSCE